MLTTQKVPVFYCAAVATRWGARAVYRILPSGGMRVDLRGITSPTGVAFEAKPNCLVVTSMQKRSTVRPARMNSHPFAIHPPPPRTAIGS
ncbi:MAG: hypothetical protein ACR2NS_16255 [Gemmatimonadaceae bacterium]